MAEQSDDMSLGRKLMEDKTVDRIMDQLTTNLDVNDVLSKCLSEGLVTVNDMSRIGVTLSSGNNAEAVRDLMSCVKRSPPGYLKKFCGILSDSKSKFLIQYVEQQHRHIKSEVNLASSDVANTSTVHSASSSVYIMTIYVIDRSYGFGKYIIHAIISVISNVILFLLLYFFLGKR